MFLWNNGQNNRLHIHYIINWCHTDQFKNWLQVEMRLQLYSYGMEIVWLLSDRTIKVNPIWQLQTGNTYISASRWDGNKISMAQPTLSRTNNHIWLIRLFSDQTGHCSSKPEVPISQLLSDKIDTLFQRLNLYRPIRYEQLNGMGLV